ncbi:MAG: transporter [Phaeodactylibacter sp.]|nr:transporter [Phaeodactylibacter sp.]
MKLNIKPIILSLFTILCSQQLSAQGCVAIRHFSSCGGNNLASNLLSKGDWQAGMNYRYFKSFRHFRGDHEEPDRVANSTEVINHAHAWDFGINYGISRRAYATLTLPFVINTRSSLYEHGREERNTTFSRGLADLRIGLGYWLFDPEKAPGGNLALGLGVKLPTGDYNATDIFYNVGPEGSPQTRPVDQSIQPGDGGFGITLDIQAFQKLADGLFAYGTLFYLANPRETNGVRTFRETLSPILQNEAIMSVPDQYAIRAGFNYVSPLPAVGLSLGARYEGVPVEDLIGGSSGFRRPGKALSLEPGVSYTKGNAALSLAVPVAMYRNRPQSLTDRETEQATGQERNGDAAFADYLINFSLSFRFNRHAAGEMPALDFK